MLHNTVVEGSRPEEAAQGTGVVSVVVDGQVLAAELKRRRIGRSTLADRCDRCGGTTWLPGDPSTVPASVLVLAAMSLTRR